MGGRGDVDLNIYTLKNIEPCKRGHAFVGTHTQPNHVKENQKLTSHDKADGGRDFLNENDDLER